MGNVLLVPAGRPGNGNYLRIPHIEKLDAARYEIAPYSPPTPSHCRAACRVFATGVGARERAGLFPAASVGPPNLWYNPAIGQLPANGMKIGGILSTLSEEEMTMSAKNFQKQNKSGQYHSALHDTDNRYHIFSDCPHREKIKDE